MVGKILFWIFYPLFFILFSLIILFYLDLANGPYLCFLFMLIGLLAYFIFGILFRKRRFRFKFFMFLSFLIFVIIDFSFAHPGYAYVNAVEGDIKKTPVLEINDGKIQGAYNQDQSVSVYTGIPYAKAPIGDLRWKEPQSPTPWTDVRDCTYFRSKSMQPKDNSITNTLVDIYAEKSWRPDYTEYKSEYASEDSLYLNVWKPNTTKTNLPVLVYIHGGSLTTGTPSFYSYNGEEMAKNDIIQVNIAYRLGVFGYLALDELANESANNTTGNYGLLDQIKALEWVRDNIHYFGGNKDNITICGESAGSSSVSALCASPLAKCLFNKAIGESSSVVAKQPPHTFRTLTDAKKTGENILKEFGCKNVEELRKIPAEKLVNTKYQNNSMTVDGYALPKTPYEIYMSGEASDVPLLNGFNSNEADAFVIPSYLFSGINTNNYIDILTNSIGNKDLVLKLVEARPLETSNLTPTEYVCNIMSVVWFAYPHYSWSKAITDHYSSNVYMYYFDKENGYYGGNHSGELTYVFKNLSRDKTKAFAYNDSDYELSNKMNVCWVSFIKTGNPSNADTNWNKWSSNECNVYHFGAKTEMINDDNYQLYKILEQFNK